MCTHRGLPCWHSGWESACHCRTCRFDWFLVQEDPTCCEAISLCTTTTEPSSGAWKLQQLSQRAVTTEAWVPRAHAPQTLRCFLSEENTSSCHSLVKFLEGKPTLATSTSLPGIYSVTSWNLVPYSLPLLHWHCSLEGLNYLIQWPASQTHQSLPPCPFLDPFLSGFLLARSSIFLCWLTHLES